MLMFSRVTDFIVKILFNIGVLSGILMVLLILVSTLMRYIADQPIPFSDELAGLLFLTLAFTTFPHVINKSGHINLNLFAERMPYSLQRVLIVVAAVIFVAFAAVFSYEAWKFMEFSMVVNSRTAVSGILLWPWMALMPASMVLCAVVEVKKLFIRKGYTPLREITS